jgi:integrase/recombinase XerC
MYQLFLDYITFEKRYSNHTVIAYENDLKQFAVFSDITSLNQFESLTSSGIRSWIVAQIDDGLTNKSVNRKIATLRTFFKWLRKEGRIQLNPMQKIRGPKSEKRLPVFAKESELEPSKLSPLFEKDFEGLRNELMFEVFYQTGIRLNELIELKEQDVTDQTIKVLGKRNKERIIPIAAELSKKITAYRLEKKKCVGETKTLFVLKNGNLMYPTFVYRKINLYLGLVTNLDKKSPHILRHTFATHMLNRGSGLETLKDLLGHASLAATQVYTHNSFAQLTAIYSQAHPRGTKK